MSTDPAALRASLLNMLRRRVQAQDEGRRREALVEYLAVTGTAPDKGQAAALAGLVPPVLPELYEKWIGLFLDRLFETAAPEQIAVLAEDTPDNEAAVVLAYLMFLESERMEKQVQQDLEAYGLDHSGDADQGGAVAGFLRSRILELAKEMNAKDKGTTH
jgi:hypothetical protein